MQIEKKNLKNLQYLKSQTILNLWNILVLNNAAITQPIIIVKITYKDKF